MKISTARMHDKGLRQKEVAAALEVNVRHLRAVMNGERKSDSLTKRVNAMISAK